MKKFLIGLMAALITMTAILPAAEAKRMGGGSSFGRQSQSVSRQSAMPAHNQATAQKQAAAPASTPQGTTQKPASPWRGILGGALLGLGLGALLSHFGIGGAFASMIGTVLMVALLAMAAMFIYRMLRRKNGPQSMQPAWAGMGGHMRTPDIGSRIAPEQPATPQSYAGSAANDAPFDIPADFDAPAFLRHAKTYFIRLQAAWDKADVNDLREFTTGEMFAELKLQLQERGPSPNHTDAVSLDADLLNLETTGDHHMASVKFSGLIRETEHAPAEPFSEVWNLIKPVSGQGGWVLAGIQQLA